VAVVASEETLAATAVVTPTGETAGPTESEHDVLARKVLQQQQREMIAAKRREADVRELYNWAKAQMVTMARCERECAEGVAALATFEKSTKWAQRSLASRVAGEEEEDAFDDDGGGTTSSSGPAKALAALRELVGLARALCEAIEGRERVRLQLVAAKNALTLSRASEAARRAMLEAARAQHHAASALRERAESTSNAAITAEEALSTITQDGGDDDDTDSAEASPHFRASTRFFGHAVTDNELDAPIMEDPLQSPPETPEETFYEATADDDDDTDGKSSSNNTPTAAASTSNSHPPEDTGVEEVKNEKLHPEEKGGALKTDDEETFAEAQQEEAEKTVERYAMVAGRDATWAIVAGRVRGVLEEAPSRDDFKAAAGRYLATVDDLTSTTKRHLANVWTLTKGQVHHVLTATDERVDREALMEGAKTRAAALGALGLRVASRVALGAAAASASEDDVKRARALVERLTEAFQRADARLRVDAPRLKTQWDDLQYQAFESFATGEQTRADLARASAEGAALKLKAARPRATTVDALQPQQQPQQQDTTRQEETPSSS